jgi:hypothetical protein
LFLYLLEAHGIHLLNVLITVSKCSEAVFLLSVDLVSSSATLSLHQARLGSRFVWIWESYSQALFFQMKICFCVW